MRAIIAVAMMRQMLKCSLHRHHRRDLGVEVGDMGECDRLHIGAGTLVIAP